MSNRGVGLSHTSFDASFEAFFTTVTIQEHPPMAQFTVRLGGVIEAACDNLATALHKADTWAKRHREVYTVHCDDKLVATATYKHTTMAAA